MVKQLTNGLFLFGCVMAGNAAITNRTRDQEDAASCHHSERRFKPAQPDHDRSRDQFAIRKPAAPARGSHRNGRENRLKQTISRDPEPDIGSIDRARLQKHLGALDAAAMRRVDEALKISLGLVAL